MDKLTDGDICEITDYGPYHGNHIRLVSFTGQSPLTPDEGDGWWVKAIGWKCECTFVGETDEFWFPVRRMRKVQETMQ